MKQTLRMTENDKTKIAIRMEYINATNEHYLDNIAKYCDFLEFKLIKEYNKKYKNADNNKRR